MWLCYFPRPFNIPGSYLVLWQVGLTGTTLGLTMPISSAKCNVSTKEIAHVSWLGFKQNCMPWLSYIFPFGPTLVSSLSVGNAQHWKVGCLHIGAEPTGHLHNAVSVCSHRNKLKTVTDRELESKGKTASDLNVCVPKTFHRHLWTGMGACK